MSGIRLRLDASLSDQMVRRLASGRHTLYERQLVLGHLAPDDIVMELGGGIGMLAIACAQSIGSERVYSYEPNPMVQPLIRDNCELNGVAPHFEMCILGREAGRQTFYVDEHFNQSSTIRTRDDVIPIEVPVKSFKEEITRINPTFLIMDVQGSEDELLRHIDFSGITKVAVEFHPRIIGIRRVGQLRRLLRGKGYIEMARQRRDFILYVRADRDQ